ncbi:hypothetical protein HMPREF0262_02110 [Clostridium sp. ATCC 29733]|nr:hypothetical protein HMPREF0262_02110 [Clostridium sp. ATCC 29733]
MQAPPIPHQYAPAPPRNLPKGRCPICPVCPGGFVPCAKTAAPPLTPPQRGRYT